VNEEEMEDLYEKYVALEYSGEWTWRNLNEIAIKFRRHFVEKYGEEDYRVWDLDRQRKSRDFSMGTIERIRYLIHAEVLGVTEFHETQHGRYLHSLKRLWESTKNGI